MKTKVNILLVGLSFGLSGAASLIYEVAWTRVLSLVLGSTVFAVTIMLATFMLGLALGGLLGGRLSDGRDHNNIIKTYGLVEFGIGAGGLVSMILINNIVPMLYYHIYSSFSSSPYIYFSLLLTLCALVMLIPTTLMGVTFPLVSKYMTEITGKLGSAIGRAYFFNTFGAIIGSLAAGFMLIPLVGTKWTIIIASALNVLVAITMLRMAGLRRLAYGTLILHMLILTAFSYVNMETSVISPTTVHRYDSYNDFLFNASRKKLLFEKNDIEGKVRIFTTDNIHMSLQVGSRVEGSTSDVDRFGAAVASLLPIAAHPDPDKMLVIGLGLGTSLASAKDHVGQIDLVEINRAVAEAVEAFGAPGVLNGVGIIIDDARHYIMMSDKTYDIIASAPSYPTTHGVSSLYTKEFYGFVSHRLAENGYFCQWMPYYYMSDDDVTMMLKTVGSAFDYVSLWKIPKSMDLFMLASNAPITESYDSIIETTMKHADSGIFSLALSKSEDEVRDIVSASSHPMNTDDRPILEFNVALNRIVGFEN